MRFIAATQRVVLAGEGNAERRDALDQSWARFLAAAGFTLLPLPNHLEMARDLVKAINPVGFLLTGGGDLAVCGGNAPERDAVEQWLIGEALRGIRPLLGVCRGMQAIQAAHGIRLERVQGHVAPVMEIQTESGRAMVNSYHDWGTRETVPSLETWALADDGVVKAIRHTTHPLVGIMWHPERFAVFRESDLDLFRRLFGGPTGKSAQPEVAP